MTDLWNLFDLSGPDLALLTAIVFVAGIVRGFTGFAQSAFTLALAVMIIPPVEIIPLVWWHEVAASLLMLKSGWRDADKKAVLILTVASFTGTFVGMTLTVWMNPEMSSLVALVLLISLALLQLLKIRIRGLATPQGTVATGLLAGVATGLAGIGGMVVALFVLARDSQPNVMRATLVLFLLFTPIGSLFVLLGYGAMNATSATRGILLIPPVLLGVWIGTLLFTPRWQRYYRPICLWLLIGLAAVSLLRTLM